MHLLKYSLTILFAAIILSPIYAQQPKTPLTGSISGKLTDAKNNPVSYATVTLFKNDTTVINGDLSKDDGSFKIDGTGIGSFRLKIESIGIATKNVNVVVTADAPDKNIGKITLSQTENTLKDVSVVGEKPIMELKVDKKVFNVEKNTTTAGGSATDVLQNVPSVSVDADGNVSLRGKSDVTILIDGKPSTLLGTDVASALQSLPAGSIESVEVITNPSAKYDAQGTGGIINIITKKDGRFGMNGTATLGAGTNDKYNGNLGLNARKGKWNLFLNSSFRLNSTYNNVTTDRTNKDSTITYQPVAPPTDSMRHAALQSFRTYEHVPRHFNGTFNTIGASFDPDKNNSITLTENINVMKFSFQDPSTYNVYNNPSETPDPIYQQQRSSSFSGMPVSSSTALDYKHKFKKKDEELSVDATYAYTDFHRSQDYSTFSDSIINGTIKNSSYYTAEHAPGDGANSTVNIWADYTDPLFTKNGKLGLGFKSQFYNFTSTNYAAGSSPVIDTFFTNAPMKSAVDTSILAIYNYSQQIHAAYVNWNDQLGKFGYQLGLRVEDAIYSATSKAPLDSTIHTSFIDYFPSAFVSYQLANQQSIYLNYSRRTNRPGFMQLIPFIDKSNPGTVNQGNPGLNPEYINNIEFSYSKSDSKGNNFILSAYYSVTQNLIEKITTPLSKDSANIFKVPQGTLYTTPVNIASGTTYGIEGTGHFQITPIWDATLNANFFQNQLVIGSNSQYSQYLSNNSGFTWFGKINTNIKLPKNFSFQVNANYESPKIITQGTLKETYWVDIALRKNLWKNKATVILNCSDVFKTHVFVTNYDLLAYNETINRVKETRIGNLTFTYRFGKQDKSAGKPRGKQDDKLKPTDEDREKNMKEGDDSDSGGGGGKGGGGK